VPGPAIGFLQEARRFFARFLAGEDNGWERQPLLRAYLQESSKPEPGWPQRRGRWIAESQWPSPRIETVTMAVRGGRLCVVDAASEGADDPQEGTAPIALASPQWVGGAAGSWCAFGLEGEHPGDQRPDDAGSLCFDSEPLVQRLEVVGAPRVELEVTVDRPQAQLVARLCEVFADGTSARVSFGLHNLGHDETHANARPLPLGQPLRVAIQLNDVAHAFAAGNRIRLALSTTYWPMVWPPPAAVTATIAPSECRLRLPRRPPCPSDAALPPLPPPVAAAAPPYTDVHEGGVRRRTVRDEAARTTVHEMTLDLEPDGSPSLLRLDDIDLEVGHSVRETFAIHDDDPLAARAEVAHETLNRRGPYSARVRLQLALRADAAAFLLEGELVASEGDDVVLRRQWRERVPRAGTVPPDRDAAAD
jgi:hypothetical protein